MRQKVAIAAGGGMAHESIALALGIARNTLEKHFAHELSAGAYQKRLDVLLAMHAAAKKGNVAAAKVYAALEPHLIAPPIGSEAGAGAPAPAPAAAPAPAKPAPVGKKAQAQADVIGALCALFDVYPLADEPGPAAVIAEALRGSQARLAAKRKQPA